MPFASDEQRKAVFAKKKLDPATEKQLEIQKLLTKTSGKMGMKKEEFAMFGGKVVTPSEKIKLQKQKEGKEVQKEKNKNNPERSSVSSKVTGREKEKQEILNKLKDKGFKITKSFESDPDEPEEDPMEFNTIELTEKQTLDAINGKRSALEINDSITGTTEDERLRHDIDVSNNLAKLEEQGKIKIENGVWKKVI